MSKVKFIHTADIHLGSLLHAKRKLSGPHVDLFNNGVYYAFKNICDAAINEAVHFIVISGDLYDREARSVKGNSLFIEQAKRLEEKGIMIYVIGGNHDPVSEKNELFNLPSNVYVFSSREAETVEFKNQSGDTVARILGQSYKSKREGRKMHLDYKAPKDGILNIAMLHTQLDNNSSYIPCSLSELKEIECVHYWALGHIHKCALFNLETSMAAYSGMPQGTDFGEEGLCGALLVEAEDSKISSIKFISSAVVAWKNIRIDIGKNEFINNISDLEDLVLSKAEELIQEDLSTPQDVEVTGEMQVQGLSARFIIDGRANVYDYIKGKEEEVAEYLVESLNSRFFKETFFLYTDSVELNIQRPVEDLDELKQQNIVIKQISEFAKQCLEQESLRGELIKQLGGIWERTDNYEDINVKKLQIDDETLMEILAQAEQLAIDSILQRSEEV